MGKENFETKLPLRFHDGEFRILMVSDVHAGIGYDAENTTRALSLLLDETKPDLVLFGGDTIGPGVIHCSTTDELRTVLDSLSEPLETREIPWAHVYGNHDDNFGVDNRDAEMVYETYPHCLSKMGPEELPGAGNYVLPVYDAKGEKILFNVFCLDSHHGIDALLEEKGLPKDTRFFDAAGNHRGEDIIRFEQIMWYWNTSLEMEKANGQKIPAMMMFHIPIPEFENVVRNRSACKIDGLQWEDVAYSPLNSGLFAACLQRGDVKGIFCGHDHENDFRGTYAGIELGYDGYLSYHACHYEELRGGRLFTLKEENPGKLESKMVLVKDFERK